MIEESYKQKTRYSFGYLRDRIVSDADLLYEIVEEFCLLEFVSDFRQQSFLYLIVGQLNDQPHHPFLYFLHTPYSQ